jgi:hypothetical protein
MDDRLTTTPNGTPHSGTFLDSPVSDDSPNPFARPEPDCVGRSSVFPPPLIACATAVAVLLLIGGAGAIAGRDWLLAFLLVLMGILASVLLAVGTILVLCELSWGKPHGDLGSTGFLVTAAILLLPWAIYLMPLIWQR